jgi:hypothetical protein
MSGDKAAAAVATYPPKMRWRREPFPLDGVAHKVSACAPPRLIHVTRDWPYTTAAAGGRPRHSQEMNACRRRRRCPTHSASI